MADVEAITSSVVREYLSRKGLKDTLAMLDKEMPRTDNCISNRAQLAKELHINSLMKKNKESQASFRTMLEVIVQFMITKTWQQKHSEQNIYRDQSHSKDNMEYVSDTTSKRTEVKQDLEHKVSSQAEVHKSSGGNQKRKSFENKSRTSIDKMKSSLRDNSESRLDNKTNEIMDLNVEHGNSAMSSRPRVKESRLSMPDDDMGLVTASVIEKQIHPQNFNQEIKDPEQLLENINYQGDTILGTYPGMKKRTLNDSSSIKSSNVKKNQRRQVSGGITSTGLHSSGKNERTRYAKEGFREKTNYLVDDFQERRSPEKITFIHTDDTKKLQDIKVSVAKKEQNKATDWRKEIMQKKEVRKSPPPSQTQLKTTKNDELLFEDLDDNLDDELDKLHFNVSRKSTMSMFQSQAITLKQAKDLKTIVFGSPAGSFNSEWKNQGFSFCHLDNLKYGIVQHKGGPCGLLASVQAVVLKQLLFNDRLSSANVSKHRLHFSSQETNDALCSAFVEILWRAGGCQAARVALRSEKDQFIPSGGYKADRFTEKLVIYEMNDLSELEIFIKENIKQLSSDDGGCILLLYSVILSRTTEKIKEDMDDDHGTLMGAHGYCTQDMVNLFLTGKAISNTFDDVIELDSGGDTKCILKGVEQQSDIGLLSLFEHYKSCLVGSKLKSPKYPIWVVCSESHFSVLFSIKRSIVNERRNQKKFDLYYYDGLASQTEEIRLTIDLSGNDMVADALDDLTPPLEHCIRTKWKGAIIDWNETEPLL